MRAYKLDKSVLKFLGGAADFLKAYASNTPDAPHTAFLDLKGRIVAVADQACPSPDEAWVAVGRPFAGRLLRHLEKFLTFSPTRVEETDLSAYYDLDGDAPAGPGDILIPQKAGRVLLTRGPLEASVSEETFTCFRLRHALPLQGADYDDEMLLNVHPEDYVSYSKGCYLGQEIIARVHHRSRPPKKLVVKTEDECSADERSRLTSRAFCPDIGQWAGFVLVPVEGD